MDTTLIELAERTNDGLGIRLLWNRGTGAVVLEVTDGKTDTILEVQVPADRAMDAFRHPFVYVEPVEPLFDAAVV